MVKLLQPVIPEQKAMLELLEIRSKRIGFRGLATVQGFPLIFWA